MKRIAALADTVITAGTRPVADEIQPEIVGANHLLPKNAHSISLAEVSA